MVLRDQDRAVAVVSTVRKRCCAYLGDRCDCKYGISTDDSAPGVRGERGNGCPELREVEKLLKALTPFEWARLVKRLERRR